MTRTRLVNYKRISLFAATSFVIVILGTGLTFKANAEEISLKVAPSLIQMRTQVPNNIRAPLIIENLSSQSVKLKIRYRLINPSKSQEGKVMFLEDQDATAEIFKYIDIVDTENVAIDTLDLGPKQQKQLQIRVNLPQNHPSADHYFSLIFAHDIVQKTDQNSTIRDKRNQHTITTIQGGIATNVLLAIGAPETAQGYVEEFSTPLYRQDGPVPFTIRVKNTGLHYIRPKGVILVRNIFGQSVGRIIVPETVILAGTSRSLLDEKQIKEGINQQFNPSIIWPERFLLGFYSADLSISMAKEGPTYNQTIRFVAFPFYLILGFLIVMVVIYLGYKKNKYK